MSTLTSSSTDAEVEAAYDDNASYREDQSTAKAKAFITACRILIRRCATRMGERGDLLEFDVGLLRDEQRAAESWAQANGGFSGPRVVRSDFSRGRE